MWIIQAKISSAADVPDHFTFEKSITHPVKLDGDIL